MGKKRKPRLCRICKKRPVWIGGDVKNPGPVCKRCYHAHVWPEPKTPRSTRAGGRFPGAGRGGQPEETEQTDAAVPP